MGWRLYRYYFGDCEYRTTTGELFVGGVSKPATATQRLLLEVLLSTQPGEVLDRDLIIRDLWHRFKIGIDSAQALFQQISRLRAHLGPARKHYIQGFGRRGYRMAVTVLRVADDSQLATSLGLHVRRPFIDVHKRITRDTFITEVEAQVEALVDAVPSIELEENIYDTTPGLIVTPRQFEWSIVASPPDVHVERRVVVDTRERYRWSFVFTPPLAKNQVVHYRYRLERMNLQPHTMEEVMSRIEAGHYPFTDPVVKAIGAVAAQMVGRYDCEVEFEPNYSIKDVVCKVYWTRTRQLNTEETGRVALNRMLSTWKEESSFHIKLNLIAPVVGCSYYVLYTPPTSSG